MTYAPSKLWTGNIQYTKQAYVFIENDAIVPIENSMYIIHHDPSKSSFKYDKK